ncbi:MAG: winged helix-turn-helix transcriptional regulator, partial [Firmicutes bacterium]|nr:winged helix-turn-helix transcriptional regulator [Bacillota bacterium]
HASYKTIGKAVNMSPNTVRKYVTELVERGLIQTEHTSIITQDGRKQNGSLLYTLLPIQFSIQQFYEQKLAKLDTECEQERIRKRVEAFQLAQQKTPVRPREPRVAAVSDFPGTAGRVPTGNPKTGRCADVRERWRKMLVLARTAVGKAACGKCGKTLKMVKIEGFWTPRRESRINGWRRNRRFSCSQQPAVRTVSRGCAGAAIGTCLEENTCGWRQEFRKRRRFKGFRRATPQIGGL